MSVASVAVLAAPASAQDKVGAPAQAAKAAAADESGDIIVTAQRREESAQTVPVSITALSPQALQEKQIRSLADLTRVSPGIRFVSQGGAGSMNIIMRGLGKSPAGDAPNSVITYFGDVPLYFWGSDIPAYDLQNVQVLKGPQGTLFGRNAIGGAVLVVPQRPTYELEGYVRGQIGNFKLRDIEGALNAPIVDDMVALRVAGKLTRRRGYYRNLTIPDNRGSDLHRDALRGSLLVEPADNIKNITVVDWFHGDEAGEGVTLDTVASQGVVRTPALAPFLDCHTVNASNPVPCVGFQPTRDIDDALAQIQASGPYSMAMISPLYLKRKLWGVQNRTELDLGAVQFRNIFGYRKTDIKYGSQAQAVALGPPPLLRGFGSISIAQLTEEVQALGQLFDDRIDWLVGGFYVHEDPTGHNWSKGEIGSTASGYASAFNNRKSKALYGQIGFQIVDGLKLNAGYRHTWDASSVCIINTPAAGGPPTFDGGDCPSDPRQTTVKYKRDEPSYTVGLDWQVNQNIFAYVTHRRSFRTGGVNAPVFDSPGTSGGTQVGCPLPGNRCVDLQPYQTYQPETLKDFEIGVKTDFRVDDVKIRFNVNAFRSELTGVQTSVNVASLVPAGDLKTPFSTGSVVINMGKRRFTGGEAELMIQPTRALTFSANAARVKQKILSFALPAALQSAFVDAGRSFALPVAPQLSPKWSYTLSGRWELPIRPADGQLLLAGDYYRQTSYGVGNKTFRPYGVANARLEWNQIANSGASLAFFATNLFDKANAVAAGATSIGLGFLSVQYGPPRMYGVEASYRF
jgi:iron complex outermembrane receptor protein